jgi:hypothetical protein
MDIIERLEDEKNHVDAIDDAIAEIGRLRDLVACARRLAYHETGCAHAFGQSCDCGYREFMQESA